MHIPSLLAAVAVSLAVASPAMAQMRTSTPAKAQNMTGQNGGVASGEDKFRPTGLFGVEFARVLADGDVVATVGSPNGDHGLGDALEFRWSTGVLTLGLGGAGAAFSFAPSVAGKYLLLNSPTMSVAALAGLNLALGAAATPFDFGFNAGVPVSLWKLGPGNLHLYPAFGTAALVAPGAAAALGLNNLSVTAGYELPIAPKWTLLVGDRLTGGLGNTAFAGGRVRFSQNLTADVGTISLSGTTLTLSLVTISGFWGG